MGLETYCYFGSDYSTSFPIAAWGGHGGCAAGGSSCSGLGKEGSSYSMRGQSWWLWALGSRNCLLFPTSEVPDFQSHRFGWGAVLVQSRNSWKHYELPDGLMAHLMGVKGEARHWCEQFCFFRDECVKGDALVNVLLGFPPGSQKCKGGAAVGRRGLAHLFPWASLG